MRVYTIKGEEEDPERGESERTAITVSIPETVAPGRADRQASSATAGPISIGSVDGIVEATMIPQFRETMSVLVQSIGAMRKGPWHSCHNP